MCAGASTPAAILAVDYEGNTGNNPDPLDFGEYDRQRTPLQWLFFSTQKRKCK